MAASREQTAAARFFLYVPAILAVPRADALIIIDFAIVNFAEQSFVEDGLDREKLAGVTAFEADARFHSGFCHGLLNRLAILPRKGERLFNDQMFAGFRRRDCMLHVLMRIAADGNDIDMFIG